LNELQKKKWRKGATPETQLPHKLKLRYWNQRLWGTENDKEQKGKPPPKRGNHEFAKKKRTRRNLKKEVTFEIENAGD